MSQKITRDQVEAEIESVEYTRIEGTTTTIATLKTKSGPVFVGTSACVAMEDFVEEVGKDIARTRAVDQLWGALGTAKAFVLGGCSVLFPEVDE